MALGGFVSMAVTLWTAGIIVVLVLYVSFRVAPILVKRFASLGEVAAFAIILISSVVILMVFNSF
jgi:hypothetical protein